MKNDTDIKWFRTYLISKHCRYVETMGTTEIWTREDNEKIVAPFNCTLQFLGESTVKDVLDKLRLPFADFEKALDNYNKHLK